MTEESHIKVLIRSYLQKTGWYVRSIASTQYTRGGLPDYFAIKKGHVLFLEVKSSKGKQSLDQVETGEAINRFGGNYLVVKSVDDVIEYLEGYRQGEIK